MRNSCRNNSVAFSLVICVLIIYNLWRNGISLDLIQMKTDIISYPHICNISTKTNATDLYVNTSEVEWVTIREENDDVVTGGQYRPLNCISKDRVAIIVPYRDRKYHLKVFIRHMHPFLKRQNIDYGILIIEMQPGLPFNRGMLMNIGYAEASKEYDYNCFIFSDVDLLPLQDSNRYVCADVPKHMAVAIDTRNFRLAYNTSFGGVNAFTTGQFEKINGFSNMYFGWGKEDDDLYKRTMSVGMNYTRLTHAVGRYKDITHTPQDKHNDNDILYKVANTRFKTDGINSLKYRVDKKELRPLYTWLLVNVTYFE